MNNPVTHQPAQEETRYKRNALIISLATGITFTIITAFLGPIAYRQNGLGGLWGVLITGAVSLAGFIGALQVSRGHTTRGIMILIATILIMSCALPFLAQGQGLALAAIVVVLVGSISSATLSPDRAKRALIAAFIISAGVVAADLFLFDVGLPTNPIYTNVIAIVTVLGYTIFILRNFGSYNLQSKIIISFILITIIPVGVLSIINNRFSTQAFQDKSKTQLTTLAKIAADTIDDFITIQLDTISIDAKQLSLINYLSTSSDPDAEKNARQTLLSLTRKNSVFIRSIAVLNSRGINVLDTLEDNRGRDESLFPYFTRPKRNGETYVSNVVFRGDRPSVYFSSPIKDLDGQVIGVLRIEYYAEIFQSSIRSLNPEDSDTIISLVDKSTYLRISHTGDRDNLFKSYKDFAEIELVAMQADGRLPPDPLRETDSDTVNGILNLQNENFFFSYFQTPDFEAINTGVPLNNQPWVALVSQPTDVYLAPVRDQNRINTLTSLLLVFLSVAAGYITSQILTSPLGILTKAAEKIASGDLTVHAAVTTKDEIGTLATVFNRMTVQLSQMLTGLEQRVAERTADLELSRQQSVKRASELQSIGEISKFIAAEQKLEELLPLITRLVSESLGFYHTGIFLLDSTNKFAVLQASNSMGGQNMLKRGHKLEIGGTSIVGHVAKSGIPRISLDVGQDAVYFNNPDLPNTRSEIALPLKVGDRIVGVLDVQSEKPGAFTEDDANTLGILADQVAIALENASLFTQTQQALNEVQALYRRDLREGWKTFSRERDFIGYQQSMISGKKLNQAIETEEIRQAMNRGETLVFHADGVTQEASIVVPIKLRGQIIGTIDIKAPTRNRHWTTDEMNLAETISERLSIALENARLLDESTRRAERERIVSDVASKIGASFHTESVLRTAAAELSQLLDDADVFIDLQTTNNDNKEAR